MRYWEVLQEELVYQWLSANTLQQFRIYNALYKDIRYMAGSILGRYFIPTQDHDDIRQEAINHLFCNLHHFDPNKGYTAYSYCQTILKNYYHGVVRAKKGKVFAIKLEYYDDLNCPEFEYSYKYDPMEEEQHYDFQPVFKRLEQARFTLLSYLSKHKRLPNKQRQVLQREAEFLLNTTEYLYEYKDSQGLSAKGIQEYTANKLHVKECLTQRLMQKHLGVCAKLVEGTTIVEDRWGLQPIDDDYSEDESYEEKKRRRKVVKYIYDNQYKET